MKDTAKTKKENRPYLFAQQLSELLCEKYERGIPKDYERLLELFRNPRETIAEDRNGNVTARADKNFRVERVFESLIDSLSIEERKRLLPETGKEAEDRLAFAKASRIGRCEDTLWRKLTGYGNWNWEMAGLLAGRLAGARCLEIMAGNGLFSYMLREKGVSVIATDIAPDKRNDYIPMRGGTYCDVEPLDALSAVRRHGKTTDILICSWPPEGEERILEAFRAFVRLRPRGKMLYVGEWKGGCSAEDSFFDSVRVIDSLAIVNAARVPHIGSRDAVRLLELLS